MKLVAITVPDIFPNEAEHINALFEAGLERLHLRKPEWKKKQTKALLKSIDPKYHRQIVLHQHHEMAPKFGIVGMHFNKKLRKKGKSGAWKQLTGEGYKLSTSVSKSTTLPKLHKGFRSVFLSPVYDSISKENYPGNRDAFLPLPATKAKVIALGGITPDHVEQLRADGFDGVAVLGYLWSDENGIVERFKKMQDQCKMAVPML